MYDIVLLDDGVMFLANASEYNIEYFVNEFKKNRCIDLIYYKECSLIKSGNIFDIWIFLKYLSRELRVSLRIV